MKKKYFGLSAMLKYLRMPKLYSLSYALAAGAFLLGDAAAATIDVAEYANLAVGYGWMYQQSQSPEPWRVEVDSVTARNGYDVFLLQEYDSRGLKNDQDFIKTDFSSGMYQVGVLNDYGQPTEETSYLEPPIPRLLTNVTPGQNYTLTAAFWGIPFNINLTIVKETVTVPAGNFPDTWKVTQTFYDGLSAYNFSYWYARGMGLVKREQEDGNIWELTGYSGFTPTTVPIPGAIWLLGSGLAGFACARIRRSYKP